MKVALCLSGQTRTFSSCYASWLKYIIDPLKPDIFVHTWLYSGKYRRRAEDFHYTAKPFDYGRYDEALSDRFLVDQSFLRLLKPKKCSVEFPDRERFMRLLPADRGSFFNSLMMHYSIGRANDLKREYECELGFRYDVVIRLRFDLRVVHLEIEDHLGGTILPRNQLMPAVARKTSGNMVDYRFREESGFMINDQFAYGSSEAMDWYSSVYKQFELDSSLFPLHPEGMLSSWLWSSRSPFPVPRITERCAVEIVRVP